MRYQLRTLLFLLAVLPPLLWIGWGKYQAWRAEQERQRVIRAIDQLILLRFRSGQAGVVSPGILQDAAERPQTPPPEAGRR